MTSRPDDPVPISPLHIADIWGKLEELEEDVNILKEQLRSTRQLVEILVLLVKKKSSEEKDAA